MNLVLEAIISIIVLLVLSFPIFLSFDIGENNYYYLNYYYNKIGKNESLRDCLIKENCNISYIKSYNCTSLSQKNFTIPERAISFFIFRKYGEYCPTLVIVDLEYEK